MRALKTGGSARAAWSAKNSSRPAWYAAVSLSRNRRRNRHESTSTERKKRGRQAIQCWPSGDKPPPGTMIWACGGSVAKASAPRDEGSDRGGPGRVGFQGAPLWRRDRALGGALVLPLRYKLSRSRADDGRTRRVGRSLDHLPMGPEVRARNREAAALALAPSALRELAGRRDLREGPRQMGLSLPSRRQAGQHDRFLSLPDAEHDGGQAFPGQGAQGAEG